MSAAAALPLETPTQILNTVHRFVAQQVYQRSKRLFCRMLNSLQFSLAPLFQRDRTSQRGQVGVIIVLIMVVLLTIGLSLATRTTQDLFLAQQQADSTRVFNAAEAGVEQALSTSLTFEGSTLNGDIADFGNLDTSNIDVNYTITKVNQLETRLFEMVTVMVDVTGVTTGQGLQIDWSKENDCNNQDPASLLVSVYYDSGGQTKVRHYPLGACDRGDGFTQATTINQDGYRRRISLALETGDLFVRVKPVYNDTHIRVSGNGWTLPVQYYNIHSEAVNTLGTEARVVEVNRTLSAAPSVMDFAVFSGSTLAK